jgi:hypothetical protein
MQLLRQFGAVNLPAAYRVGLGQGASHAVIPQLASNILMATPRRRQMRPIMSHVEQWQTILDSV